MPVIEISSLEHPGVEVFVRLRKLSCVGERNPVRVCL